MPVTPPAVTPNPAIEARIAGGFGSPTGIKQPASVAGAAAAAAAPVTPKQAPATATPNLDWLPGFFDRAHERVRNPLGGPSDFEKRLTKPNMSPSRIRPSELVPDFKALHKDVVDPLLHPARTTMRAAKDAINSPSVKKHVTQPAARYARDAAGYMHDTLGGWLDSQEASTAQQSGQAAASQAAGSQVMGSPAAPQPAQSPITQTSVNPLASLQETMGRGILNTEQKVRETGAAIGQRTLDATQKIKEVTDAIANNSSIAVDKVVDAVKTTFDIAVDTPKELGRIVATAFHGGDPTPEDMPKVGEAFAEKAGVPAESIPSATPENRSFWESAVNWFMELEPWQKVAVLGGVALGVAGLANAMLGGNGFMSIALGGLGAGAAMVGSGAIPGLTGWAGKNIFGTHKETPEYADDGKEPDYISKIETLDTAVRDLQKMDRESPTYRTMIGVIYERLPQALKGRAGGMFLNVGSVGSWFPGAASANFITDEYKRLFSSTPAAGAAP